jgi:hypothetical protein
MITEVEVNADDFSTEELIDSLHDRNLTEGQFNSVIDVIRSYPYFKEYENCEKNKPQSLDDLLKEEHFEKVRDKYTLAEFYERLPE